MSVESSDYEVLQAFFKRGSIYEFLWPLIKMAAKLFSKAKLKGHNNQKIDINRKPSLFRRTLMLQVHRAIAVQVSD